MPKDKIRNEIRRHPIISHSNDEFLTLFQIIIIVMSPLLCLPYCVLGPFGVRLFFQVWSLASNRLFRSAFAISILSKSAPVVPNAYFLLPDFFFKTLPRDKWCSMLVDMSNIVLNHISVITVNAMMGMLLLTTEPNVKTSMSAWLTMAAVLSYASTRLEDITVNVKQDTMQLTLSMITSIHPFILLFIYLSIIYSLQQSQYRQQRAHIFFSINLAFICIWLDGILT